MGPSDDVSRVASSLRAFEEWRDLKPTARGRYLLDLADLVDEHADRGVVFERVAELQPEVERVDAEEERRGSEPAEGAEPVRRAPRDQREGGQDSEPRGPCQEGEACRHAGAREAAALGEQERCERQQQEERLRVHRLQEERHREERQVEDGAPASVEAEPLVRDPLQQKERAEGCGERHEHACDHVVAEEHSSEASHHPRVEREEGVLARSGVAVLGDTDEPLAVPARPDVDDPA